MCLHFNNLLCKWKWNMELILFISDLMFIHSNTMFIYIFHWNYAYLFYNNNFFHVSSYDKSLFTMRHEKLLLLTMYGYIYLCLPSWFRLRDTYPSIKCGYYDLFTISNQNCFITWADIQFDTSSPCTRVAMNWILSQNGQKYIIGVIRKCKRFWKWGNAIFGNHKKNIWRIVYLHYCLFLGHTIVMCIINQFLLVGTDNRTIWLKNDCKFVWFLLLFLLLLFLFIFCHFCLYQQILIDLFFVNNIFLSVESSLISFWFSLSCIFRRNVKPWLRNVERPQEGTEFSGKRYK